MGKDHLKRLTAPRKWQVLRKAQKFITRPKPSRGFELAMPLSHIMKVLLGKARTTKEARFLLRYRNVSVNGRRARDHRRAVGFMDVIGFPDIKEYFRITLGPKGRIVAAPIDAKNADFRVVKIIGKTRTAGLFQINCEDGSNFDSKKDQYKTGDSLLLKDNAIAKHLALEKGATIMLVGGSHLSMTGEVTGIDGRVIEFKNDHGTFTTARKYAFVVSEEVL